MQGLSKRIKVIKPSLSMGVPLLIQYHYDFNLAGNSSLARVLKGTN